MALPHTQAIGTTCDSSITAGRSDSIFPAIFGCALLPKVMLITPSFTSSALTKLLTTFSGAGNAASLLSTGSVLAAFQLAP